MFSPDRVTHVVQTVKERNQVVLIVWYRLSAGGFEVNAIVHSRGPLHGL
jgi:hypothetical protein